MKRGTHILNELADAASSAPSLSDEKKRKVFHSVADEVAGVLATKTVTSGKQGDVFAQRDLAGLTKYGISYMADAFSREASIQTVEKEMKEADVPEEWVKAFLEVYELRSGDLRNGMITKANLISQGMLENFDWKVQTVMATDKLSGMQWPVLLLKLIIRRPNESTQELLLELSREEVDDVLQKFQAIENSAGELAL